MNDKGNELLNMFIRDSYKNASGKPSRATTLALMKYVRENESLQSAVNNSDWKRVLTHDVNK